MKQAFVVLSDKDADNPELPGIATVSKNTPWDEGGFYLGEQCVRRGGLWVDRPYFVGNPGIDWLINECRNVTEYGGYCQVGNEPNLDVEGWQGGPQAWFKLWEKLNQRYPEGNWIAGPPSPGTRDWQVWVIPTAKRHAVHCYGSFQQMQNIVQWFLLHTGSDLYITECNPGAGNTFDLNHWAWNDFKPFLDWCSQQPRVKFVAYFAYHWDMSHTLPNSIDGAGTEVETVLKTWQPPASHQTHQEGKIGGSMSLYEEWVNQGGDGTQGGFVAHLRGMQQQGGGVDPEHPEWYGYPQTPEPPLASGQDDLDEALWHLRQAAALIERVKA